jgi:palmitoyltransferase
MLVILLIRTVWSLCGNVTTIESWEIERHGRLLRRSRVFGGYLDGPNGVKVRIQKQEFPYDIGIWRNITQGMDSGLPVKWLWPFAATPRSNGLEFETNGFEDPSKSWPPPDPDRMPRTERHLDPNEAFTYPNKPLSNYDEMEAFKMRQREDLLRRQNQPEIHHRKPFHERHGSSADVVLEYNNNTEYGNGVDDSASESGEEGWQDSGGNRLKDYGVDEVIEFYDEDEIPLSELLRRRKAREQ